MHIVLVAWLYVALLVAATEPSLVGSAMSFLFYGLLPAAIIAYIGTTGQRKKRRRLRELQDKPLAKAAGDNDGAQP
ncbi:MAG: hypothetical protein FGM40_05405 [Rhodocyclaceae bacterium]|nr:hypothetical protein [Rhodocyclaceae bacterium]